MRRRNYRSSLSDPCPQLPPFNISDLAIITLQSHQVLSTIIAYIVTTLQPVIQTTMENILDIKLEPVIKAVNSIEPDMRTFGIEIDEQSTKIKDLEEH